MKRKLVALGFVVTVGLAGLVLMRFGHAATLFKAAEAETGVIAGNAAKVNGSGASGQGENAVRFGAAAAGVWSSGVTSLDQDGFAAWRGRPLDNSGTWPNRETWDVISNPDIYGAVTELAKYKQISIGAAMLPEQQTSTFAQCAAGAYDSYWKTYGSNLVKLNRNNANTFIRLGWEANGDWFAWSIGSDTANYKACFKREVQAIRSVASNVKIDWNMNKDSHMGTLSVADAYPGDDVVDVVGVDFYDQWPAYTDKASWDADYMTVQNGGPRGMGAWLAFARAHGKKFSVPEWGLANGGANQNGSGGTDNPYFIQAMYDFFSAHSADLAYETYFNLDEPAFLIWPAGINPQGSAKYQQLWSASPRP